MKRRAISLLAVVAMLCTMVVFAMPATVAAAETYPFYKDHALYGEEQKDWSISSKEDWDAMREVADVATEDYFKDFTFHLTNDIDFNFTQMAPMGINSNGAGFAGTIDGHGFGFNDIYILNGTPYGDKTASGADIRHTGLFLRLGKCTFKDFGLNSGLILQASGNAAGAISSFGTVMEGKTPTFERVWSSVYISNQYGGRANGLVGTIDNAPITVNVNGFVFDGGIAKNATKATQFNYAVLHTGNNNANPGTFHNIITDCESYNGKVTASGNDYTVTRDADIIVQSALFDFSTLGVLNTLPMGNVYGVKRKTYGIQGGYSIGNALNSYSKSASLLTEMSAVEAAYTINEKNQKGESPEGVTPVYFKLNSEGKVRPIPEGKTDGKIVKIAVTGAVTKNVFVAPNSTIDLKKELGYKSEITFVKSAGEGDINGTSVTVGTGDVTVAMTNPCSDHTFNYERDIEKQQHSGTCSNCGHQVTEACTLTNCTNDESGNAETHTGDCGKCGATSITQVCAYEYTKTDDGYKYVCSCGRNKPAAAPMVAGDVNDNATVDLLDAIQLLKKAVNMTVTINERNADVDGNNEIEVKDVYKIILHFLKDAETIEEFAATKERVNEPNFYNQNNIKIGNLKMDGTEDANERYVRTGHIAVSKGNKVVFGPIRKSQAVMGHFYDAKGNAIELINVNNTRLQDEYTFKAEVQGKEVEVINYGEDAVVYDLLPKTVDGLEMVSITVPEGAAYVRLQANAKEADQFYIRINNKFSLADYQCRTNGDANTLKNEENGQLFLTIGDSLCSASYDNLDTTVPQKGWEGRIRRDLGADTVDFSQGGSTLSIKKYYITGSSDVDTEGSSTSYDPRKCIVNQVTMQRDNGIAFEYVLLEGGANDAGYDADVGFIADSYNPEDFAPEDTFIGGLERAIYSIIKTYGDTAAIGFMLPYPMPLDERFTDMGNYFEYVDEVCAKWDIPYLDLYYDKLRNFDTEKYTTDKGHTGPDYKHAGGEGYDIMQKYITPFVENDMRPANQKIFLEIQNYEDIPQNLGKNISQ